MEGRGFHASLRAALLEQWHLFLLFLALFYLETEFTCDFSGLKKWWISAGTPGAISYLFNRTISVTAGWPKMFSRALNSSSLGGLREDIIEIAAHERVHRRLSAIYTMKPSNRSSFGLLCYHLLLFICNCLQWCQTQNLHHSDKVLFYQRLSCHVEFTADFCSFLKLTIRRSRPFYTTISQVCAGVM